jgi:hypothetical protein
LVRERAIFFQFNAHSSLVVLILNGANFDWQFFSTNQNTSISPQWKNERHVKMMKWKGKGPSRR